MTTSASATASSSSSASSSSAIAVVRDRARWDRLLASSSEIAVVRDRTRWDRVLEANKDASDRLKAVFGRKPKTQLSGGLSRDGDRALDAIFEIALNRSLRFVLPADVCLGKKERNWISDLACTVLQLKACVIEAVDLSNMNLMDACGVMGSISRVAERRLNDLRISASLLFSPSKFSVEVWTLFKSLITDCGRQLHRLDITGPVGMPTDEQVSELRSFLVVHCSGLAELNLSGVSGRLTDPSGWVGFSLAFPRLTSLKLGPHFDGDLIFRSRDGPGFSASRLATLCVVRTSGTGDLLTQIRNLSATLTCLELDCVGSLPPTRLWRVLEKCANLVRLSCEITQEHFEQLCRYLPQQSFESLCLRSREMGLYASAAFRELAICVIKTHSPKLKRLECPDLDCGTAKPLLQALTSDIGLEEFLIDHALFGPDELALYVQLLKSHPSLRSFRCLSVSWRCGEEFGYDDLISVVATARLSNWYAVEIPYALQSREFVQAITRNGLICEISGRPGLDPAVNEREAAVQRNRSRRLRWIYASILIRFAASNSASPFVWSVLPLIHPIAALTGPSEFDAPPDLDIPKWCDRFSRTRFARARITTAATATTTTAATASTSASAAAPAAAAAAAANVTVVGLPHSRKRKEQSL